MIGLFSSLMRVVFGRGLTPRLPPPPPGVTLPKLPLRHRRGHGGKNPALQMDLAALRSLPIRPAHDSPLLASYRREMNARKRARRARKATR